jgi:LDH2 family malate/lactate/ureidoglycolate dehydrogenase
MTQSAAAHRGTSDEIRVAPDKLREFARQIFEKVGMSAEDAAILADHLVWCDLRAVPHNGVVRVPIYAGQLRAGGTNPTAQPRVVSDKGAFAVIDGGDGSGPVVSARAMRMAIDKARISGVGVVSVHDTSTLGAIGYTSMLAARANMIGLTIHNSPPVQAAHGGSTAVLPAETFSVASPTSRGPLLLDMTTMALSKGRVHEYAARQEPIPPAIALSPDGKPTTDPDEAIAGVMLPMAGYRGYGLAVMWEVLSGVLAGGAHLGGGYTSPATDADPWRLSTFLMAIDPTAAMPYDTFVARVDAFIDYLHASPATGPDPVRVPGERTNAIEAERKRDGIPLPTTVIDRLRELGSQLDVGWP